MMWRAQAISTRPVARHVIQRILNPRFLSYVASYDVARIVRPALPRGLQDDLRRLRVMGAEEPGERERAGLGGWRAARGAADPQVGPARSGSPHVLFCFFITFIEPQGTHMVSINQPPPPFQDLTSNFNKTFPPPTERARNLD